MQWLWGFNFIFLVIHFIIFYRSISLHGIGKTKQNRKKKKTRSSGVDNSCQMFCQEERGKSISWRAFSIRGGVFGCLVCCWWSLLLGWEKSEHVYMMKIKSQLRKKEMTGYSREDIIDGVRSPLELVGRKIKSTGAHVHTQAQNKRREQKSKCRIYFIYFYYDYYLPHHTTCRTLVPCRRIESGPSAVKVRILTTGPPGESQNFFFYYDNLKYTSAPTK